MTIKTQQDDARSIISDELADQIDERYRVKALTGRSEVMVVRSEGDEPESDDGANPTDDSPTVERGDYSGQPSPIKQAYHYGKMMREQMPMGATSFSDLEERQNRHEQLEAIVKTLCNGEMVIASILKDATADNQPVQIVQALRDQLDRVEATLNGNGDMIRRAKHKQDMNDDEDEDEDETRRSIHEQVDSDDLDPNTGPDEPVQRGVTMNTQEMIEAGQDLGEMITAIASGPGERRSKYRRAQQAIEDFVYRSETAINEATPGDTEPAAETETGRSQAQPQPDAETSQRLNDLSQIVRSLAVTVEKLSDKVDTLQQQPQSEPTQQQPVQPQQQQQPVGRSLTNSNQPPHPLPQQQLPQGVNGNGKQPPMQLRSMIRKQYGLTS